MAQLQIAADSNDRHARSAHQMLLEINEPTKALEEALRKAVHSLSAPAVEPGKPPDQPRAPAPAAPAPAPAAPTPPAGPR
jgi:hypothetical protein